MKSADKLITVLNDDDTFTNLEGSRVVLMSKDWDGFDVDEDQMEEEFCLDSPDDLRALADLLERGT